MKNAQAVIAKLSEVAMRRYEMIKEGDRILVAVSGGKDSTALAFDLASKRSWWPERFSIRAIHIATDFCSCCKGDYLKNLMESLEIDFVDVDVPVIARLKPGRTMNCWWCSTQRRTELIRYAMANGFNTIALGHHLDDIVETLIMNMMYKGQISTMSPVVKYIKYPLTVIRPLALCEERQVISYADERGFRKAACTCPYGVDSKRRIVRKKILDLTGGSSDLKRNIYNSMSNINAEYLA